MHGTVARWGNSLALRLPKTVAASANLSAGQAVEFEVTDEAIIVRRKRNRLKLADLLEGYERQEGAEADWGAPTGDEAW